MLNLISQHLKDHFEHHLAAAGGSVTSLLLTGISWSAIIQSVVVGYSLFLLTSLTKYLWSRWFK